MARYSKVVNDLAARVQADPAASDRSRSRDLGWAIVEVEMLRLHVCRRLSDRLDGISHGPEGSVDKLLMTWVEQTVGHAALAVGGVGHGRRRRHLAEDLPLQPGPERHGRHVTDPAQPGRPPDPRPARVMTATSQSLADWPPSREPTAMRPPNGRSPFIGSRRSGGPGTVASAHRSSACRPMTTYDLPESWRSGRRAGPGGPAEPTRTAQRHQP